MSAADEAKMEAALAPFGWCRVGAVELRLGPDFWKRYYSDAWVFNLANAAERLSEQLGAALMHVRLAMTATDLIADGFSDDRDEPRRILAALCARLIDAGAVDPMEQP